MTDTKAVYLPGRGLEAVHAAFLFDYGPLQ